MTIKKPKIKKEETEEKKEELISEKPKRKNLHLLWLLIIPVLLILISLPTKSITCYEMETVIEQEPYTDTEYYYEEVPYSTTECDTENLGYNINWASYSYCVDSNFWGTCQKYKKMCSLEIKNLDNKERGYFSFIGYGKDENGVIMPEKEVGIWVQPQTTETGTWSYYYLPEEYVSCYYKDFKAGTKRVCKDVIATKSIEKSRLITKYRDVEKVVNKPFTKQVNWLFGSC